MIGQNAISVADTTADTGRPIACPVQYMAIATAPHPNALNIRAAHSNGIPIRASSDNDNT